MHYNAGSDLLIGLYCDGLFWRGKSSNAEEWIVAVDHTRVSGDFICINSRIWRRDGSELFVYERPGHGAYEEHRISKTAYWRSALENKADIHRNIV